MFVKITILEAEGAAGPFDATITIKMAHRAPWFPNHQFAFTQLALGQPSGWVDVSEKIADKQNVVTAALSLTVKGEPVKTPVRARVALGRKHEADEPTVLASIEVADPGGVLGFVMPECGVTDDDMPTRLASIDQIAGVDTGN